VPSITPPRTVPVRETAPDARLAYLPGAASSRVLPAKGLAVRVPVERKSILAQGMMEAHASTSTIPMHTSRVVRPASTAC
jgi:hypothetical protein